MSPRTATRARAAQLHRHATDPGATDAERTVAAAFRDRELAELGITLAELERLEQPDELRRVGPLEIDQQLEADLAAALDRMLHEVRQQRRPTAAVVDLAHALLDGMHRQITRRTR